VTQAKHFVLFHGRYSRAGFYHPGPFYLQWMAFFEWLFVDVLHVFVSPWAAHTFSIAFLHILAFALYLRLWLIWTRSIVISIAALLITNAVAAASIGMNYVLSAWPAHFFPESSLMVVTGFIGMTVLGPSWLPVFVFGLVQLVHGHASSVGLAPIIVLTAAAAAWMGGRLPNQIWQVDNIATYVKSHPVPFLLSAAIAILFAMPIVIHTIVVWPGEFPKYFRSMTHNSFVSAVSYVISFVPLKGLWTSIFLLPGSRAAKTRPTATDCRFVGLSFLLIAGVPGLIYAYRGVDDFKLTWLMYWILPFIGATLTTAIIYFASLISLRWVRFGIIAAAAFASLNAYRVWTVTWPPHHNPRSTAFITEALAKLAHRAAPDQKIAIRLDRDPVGWLAWVEVVAIIAAMNRADANFLCVEPNSWHLVFHQQYRCKAFDNISDVIHVLPKGRSNRDRIAELADGEIMTTLPPSIGSKFTPSTLGDTALVFSGDWSLADTAAIWSDGKKASLSFDTSLLPPRFAISIQARLFPSMTPPEQKVGITDDQGRELDVLTSTTSKHSANTRIELTRPASGKMMTLHFEISRPIAPREIGYNRWDRRSLGIGIEQIIFTEAAAN
jgi:hypothetical protein